MFSKSMGVKDSNEAKEKSLGEKIENKLKVNKSNGQKN